MIEGLGLLRPLTEGLYQWTICQSAIGAGDSIAVPHRDQAMLCVTPGGPDAGP